MSKYVDILLEQRHPDKQVCVQWSEHGYQNSLAPLLWEECVHLYSRFTVMRHYLHAHQITSRSFLQDQFFNRNSTMVWHVTSVSIIVSALKQRADWDYWDTSLYSWQTSLFFPPLSSHLVGVVVYSNHKLLRYVALQWTAHTARTALSDCTNTPTHPYTWVHTVDVQTIIVWIQIVTETLQLWYRTVYWIYSSYISVLARGCTIICDLYNYRKGLFSLIQGSYRVQPLETFTMQKPL